MVVLAGVGLLLQVIHDLDDTGTFLPGQLTDDSYLDFSKLNVQLWWDVWIDLQEDVQDSPQIKGWLFDDLDEIIDLQLFDLLDEELDLTGADDD